MWGRRASLAVAAAAIAAATLAGPAHAAAAGDDDAKRPSHGCGGVGPNLVRDGGFERPVVEGGAYRIVAAGGSIGAWRVARGAADFIACGFWRADEGCQSVDLNSCEPASIEQALATKKGRRYALCFSIAGNPDDGPRRKRLEVWWAGARIDVVEFDASSRTRERMGWERRSYAVTAPSDSVVLGFRSVTRGCYGPVLDDVVVRELRLDVAETPPSGPERLPSYSFITRASSSVSTGTTW